MEQLNTLKSLKAEGFKIKRDGKVTSISNDEAEELYHLINVSLGSDAILSYLSTYANLSPIDKETLKLMAADERVCFDIRQQYLNRILDNNEEMDVVEEYLDTYKNIYFNF